MTAMAHMVLPTRIVRRRSMIYLMISSNRREIISSMSQLSQASWMRMIWLSVVKSMFVTCMIFPQLRHRPVCPIRRIRIVSAFTIPHSNYLNHTHTLSNEFQQSHHQPIQHPLSHRILPKHGWRAKSTIRLWFNWWRMRLYNRSIWNSSHQLPLNYRAQSSSQRAYKRWQCRRLHSHSRNWTCSMTSNEKHSSHFLCSTHVKSAHTFQHAPSLMYDLSTLSCTLSMPYCVSLARAGEKQTMTAILLLKWLRISLLSTFVTFLLLACRSMVVWW